MKLFLQILFLLTTCLTNQTNATPVFVKVVLPSSKVVFSKEENVKKENVLKIGVENFAKSSIEDKNQFSKTSKREVWASVAYSERNVKRLQGAGDVVFGSAREFVRTKYGQNVLNQLAAKFGASNDGAAAVILQKWGDDGLAILNKSTVNTLDAAAKELVKNKTMYRYVNETSYNFEKLRTQGLIDASPSQFPGYATLDKIDNAVQAQSILQLPKQPTWVAEFSSSQIINDVRFPTAKFNNADYTEVLTRSYPEWGVGGGSQFITNSQIKVTRLRNLTTGEVITFP